MDEAGLWRLSPAYDLTYIIDTGGYLPNTGHCMYVRSKLHHISYDDAIQFAKDSGIRRADAIIREVADSLRQFREIAKRYEVQDRWICSIESAINAHLVSWGLEDKGDSLVAFEIDGKSWTDVRIEQAYKGNFHLYASIDGREYKFVIGKNKPEYALIQELGVSNLPESMLRDLVAKYLVR